MRMNNDLISRDDTIAYIRDHFCNKCDTYNGVKCVFCDTGDAISALKDVPAVDSVKVVYCYECKYFEADTGFCNFHGHGMHVDDFCSRGRKRE